ncbi:hypothetical protein IQ37_17270 [Chryseobacterium piperi]|uniref:Uncharacterized protein n=1 Tax=Chryseobacterium piperi TaxID=558152 RepID=A0A086AKM0_9FLAO|nr:hypothetical protein [Chryseobacterium piperi]ASW75974.1 hypothetical protein CJF12_18000 [Chryseobacterium piperi]KFF17234.1 hypothetical protein IQ37_17270 [Chryseobacterium piperi]
MKTPIYDLLLIARNFNSNREMLLPFLMSNALKLKDDEKDFIKQVYKDALKESGLTDAQKEVKAELYYNENFSNNRH